jgi:hypothetical protein
VGRCVADIRDQPILDVAAKYGALARPVSAATLIYTGAASS